MNTLITIAQIVIAAGLLNVWLVRARNPTPFRGGDARNMREEFAEYGLPSWAMGVVGTLKVSLALMLLASVWIPSLLQPAAIGVAALMCGAVAMHTKVRDPLVKSVPALTLLVLSVFVSVA